MTERLLKVLPLGVFGALIAILTAGFAPAQVPVPLVPPGQPAQPDPIPLPLPGQPEQLAQGDGIDVLAKGPVHEAFAATAEAPTASPVVAKQPPDPIEELPPDQKPEGDNVQWLPGYWSWDEENSRFIWISGFWRQPPPGRVWVPGSWREARGGFQWVSGFWQAVAVQQPQDAQQQPEVQYLPEPLASVEMGPSVPAPTATSFYAPGSWVWRGKYVWRPGVWVEYRPNWVWTPARYQWTPAGYVFVEGYWDYPLATRGVLFAPIAFSRPVYVQPAFVYTPVYVVSEPCMVGALFVRRGHGNYYFGDYYEPQYATVGYTAWCGTYTRTGFSVGFGVGRNYGYDPLFSYYSVSHRDTPAWNRGVGDLYQGRYRNEIARPPVTLVQQNTTINNITKTNVTNVTNNITVVNGAATVGNRDVSGVTMLAPLKAAPDLNRTKFQAVSAENRRTEAVAAKQLTAVAVQRNTLETAAVKQAVAQPVQPGQPPAPPKSIKLDVPKAVVARAHPADQKQAPPPNPHHAAVGGPKVDPKTPIVLPKVDPKPPIVLPKAEPKVDPKGQPNPPLTPVPKVDLPKVDPKPKVDPPKVDPKVPKVDPPKVDLPKPKVELPKVDPPKVDPKPPVTPPVKVDPPKLPPNPPVTPPVKIDPPKPPVTLPPMPPVKVDPPKLPPNPPVIPPPKVELPKVDPKPPVVPPVAPPVTPPPKVELPKLPPVGPPPVGNPPPKGPPPKTDPPKQPLAFAPPVAQPQPVQVPKPAPVVVAAPPKVEAPKAPPVVVAPPAPPRPAPVIAPPVQPRAAASVPAAQAPKVVQPAKAQPAAQPKAAPAPLGKPAPKERGNRE